MLFDEPKELKQNKKPFEIAGPVNDDYIKFIDAQE